MATGVQHRVSAQPVSGFRLGTAMAGIRQPSRRDLVVMNWDEGSAVAGVFTQNRFCAAPVQICRERLGGNPCFFVVNTGNANAGTGAQGITAARQTTAVLAELAKVGAEQVMPFSTGVIGEQLPVEKIFAKLPDALADLKEDNWDSAAEGIMTTDTRPKSSCRQFTHDGQIYTVSGISKGAGMIKPNMATMLAFIATDLAVEQVFLQRLLLDITHQSFNRITIDGDTSTNDSFMVVATGSSGNEAVASANSELGQKFMTSLREVAVELARAIVRDGEGATKFVTIKVENAATSQDALEVAYTVAHSPLVKTALFASDPNWGRILAAVGRAEIAELIIDRVSIWLDEVAIVKNGQPAPDYTEAAGLRVMALEDVTIRISLGAGAAEEELWTTDLSHEYVKINAEYRT